MTASINEQLLEAKTYEDIKKIVPSVSALAKKTDGMTPITWLAKHGKWDLVEEIATKNQTDYHDDFDYRHALALAIKNHKNEAVLALIKANTPLNKLVTHQKTTMNLWQWALSHNNLEAAADLLEENSDLSCSSNVNLSVKYNGVALIPHLAKQENWTLMTELVMQHTTDKDDSYGYGAALALAIQHGATLAARKLIENNAPLNQHFHSNQRQEMHNLLHIALLHKNSEIAQLLIQKCPSLVLDKIDAPGKPEHGKTALHLATINKDFATINLIVSKVIKYDPDNTLGINEALYLSAQENKKECVESLLKIGADHKHIDYATLKPDMSKRLQCIDAYDNAQKLIAKFGSVRNQFFGIFASADSKKFVSILAKTPPYGIAQHVEQFVADRFKAGNYSRKIIIPLILECNLMTKQRVDELEEQSKTANNQFEQ